MMRQWDILLFLSLKGVLYLDDHGPVSSEQNEIRLNQVTPMVIFWKFHSNVLFLGRVQSIFYNYINSVFQPNKLYAT